MGLVIALLLPVMAFWIYQTMILHSSDLSFYEKMLQDKKIAASLPSPPTNQQRMGVQKDIWFSQDDRSRLHYKILSESSYLTLSPVKNKVEIVEKLLGIKGWMQEKLFYSPTTHQPMQQTRYIEAAEGVYRYTNQEFIANQVNLALFQLPTHLLPDTQIEKTKAFLHGVAKDISLHFSGKTPQFNAEQFKATVVKDAPR